MRHVTCIRSEDASSRASVRQDARNSAFAEGLRRRLQALLPYGAIRRMAGRLAAFCGPRGVEDQVEGRNRLSVDVLVEGWTELPDEAAREHIDELIGPRGFAAVPKGLPGSPRSVIAANASVLSAVGELETCLAEAIHGEKSPGVVDQDECRDIARTIVEARTRLQQMENALFGGVR